LNPPEWVITLPKDGEGLPPYFLVEHADAIRDFMNSTTDSVRLVRASEVSRLILAKYELQELEELRSAVQVSELLRIIPYGRQTDHSAHTLYVYLLGIYMFLACLPVRQGIAKALREDDNSSQLVKRFLFQWVFASLLHDIGYVFQGRSKTEIRAVDRMFRATSIARLMGQGQSAQMRRRINQMISEKRPTAFEAIENPEDMLSALSYVPWGQFANFCDDTFESFSVYAPQQRIGGRELEQFAYSVASGGYDGQSEGTVDHAIASGLFLFRYSTMWYWLAKEFRFEGEFSHYRDGGYPERDVVEACFASAGHNLIGVHAAPCNPLRFEENPILYLSVLCDELQKWDRFPAGESHLGDLKSYERYCTDSERVTMIGSWDKEAVVVEYRPFPLAERVLESLRRLDSPERFVHVKPPTGLG
jgi:hypothetical protein